MLSVNYITTFLNESQNPIEKYYYNKIQFFERIDTQKDVYSDVSIIVQENTQIDKQNNPLKSDTKNILEKYYQNIPEHFTNIFNKNILFFYYDNRIYKNKSPIFTFINSILRIGNDIFNFYSEPDKELYIKNFIKKIDEDLFEKNLYDIFNYNKNKYFNKANIQEALKYGLQFKNNENFELLKTYISDYLGVNIFIFNLTNISETEKYLTKRFGNVTKYVPTFLLCFENEIYKPILMKDNKIEQNISLLIYSKHKNIIDNIFKYYNIVSDELLDTNENPQKLIEKIELPNIFKVIDKIDKIDKDGIICSDVAHTTFSKSIEFASEQALLKLSKNDNELEIKKEIKKENKKLNLSYFKNIKIDEIKEICIKNNISVQKKSEKTTKMINKLKNELIEDLLIITNPIL
jgi:hypothetical protein